MENNQQILKCGCCERTDKELLRCTRCKKVYYCGAECQKKHWPNHKIHCSKPIQASQKDQPKSKNQTTSNNIQGIAQFENLKHLGSGNFSEVFKANSKKDGKTYAIKQVEKAQLQRVRKEADLFMEKHCLSKMKQCPYVIKLHRTFQDELSLYIQMECPEKGELWGQAKHFGIISESQFKYFAAHTLKAVWTIHEQFDIVHRDLKPENILLNEKFEIKLIDFGTARDLSRPDIKGSGNGLKGRKPFEHYVGTPNYMAPECIHNKASQKISDVYSLGGVLYFLKVGSPPFAAASEYMIFKKSLDHQIYLCDELFPKDLQDLIQKMNRKQMGDRISLPEILKHPYFSDVDFNNLPSYEGAVEQQSQFQLLLMKHCQYLMETYPQLHKVEVEQRKQIFREQILPYLQEIVASNEEKHGKQQLENRILIMRAQIEHMLNLREDNNLGFVEIYKELKQIPDIDKELKHVPEGLQSKEEDNQLVNQIDTLKIEV